MKAFRMNTEVELEVELRMLRFSMGGTKRDRIRNVRSKRGRLQRRFKDVVKKVMQRVGVLEERAGEMEADDLLCWTSKGNGKKKKSREEES